MTYDDDFQWSASEYIGREHRNANWGEIDYHVDATTTRHIVALWEREQLDDPFIISERLRDEGRTVSPATVEWVLEEAVEQS